MPDRILFVDDEPNLLEALRRQLRGRFNIATATGTDEALALMRSEGPFAVVVADMRMPRRSGLELLTEVRSLYPDTVRMMLTGNADRQTAADAVSKGEVFQFIPKPCDPETLFAALKAGLELNELQIQIGNIERRLKPAA